MGSTSTTPVSRKHACKSYCLLMQPGCDTHTSTVYPVRSEGVYSEPGSAGVIRDHGLRAGRDKQQEKVQLTEDREGKQLNKQL